MHVCIEWYKNRRQANRRRIKTRRRKGEERTQQFNAVWKHEHIFCSSLAPANISTFASSKYDIYFENKDCALPRFGYRWMHHSHRESERTRSARSVDYRNLPDSFFVCKHFHLTHVNVYLYTFKIGGWVLAQANNQPVCEPNDCAHAIDDRCRKDRRELKTESN